MDIGSGTGNLTGLLAETIPHDRVVGVDIDPAMVEFSSKTCQDPTMEFHVQDVSTNWVEMSSAVKSLEGQVDLVFSHRALHWVRDEGLPEVAKNIWRLLRPGAPFYITTRFIIDMNETLPEIQRNENEELLKIPSRLEQEKKWHQVFESAGFSGLSVEFTPKDWVYETEENFSNIFKGAHLYFRRFMSNALTEEEKDAIWKNKFQDLFRKANSTPLGKEIMERPNETWTCYYGQFEIKGKKPSELSAHEHEELGRPC